MHQYDVFENPNVKARKSTPYLVVIQSEASSSAWTIIVAPLARKTDMPADNRSIIPVQFDGEAFVLLLPAMGAISKHLLLKQIGSLRDLIEHMPRAIDHLFLGM